MWRNKPYSIVNTKDRSGNPTGGCVKGIGLIISWQDGPLGRPPKPPDGTFVEDVIIAAKQRLDFYQASSFFCRENAIAITKLEEALHWLQSRRQDREAREVQGLNKG